MTYSGQVQNGVIVLDGKPALPDGAIVRVELIDAPAADANSEHERPLGQVLLQLAGQAVGLPADAASNHDAYLADRNQRALLSTLRFSSPYRAVPINITPPR